MKEQFVTYEIALKLKELGFSENCFAHYYKDESFAFNQDYKSRVIETCSQNNDWTLAPLWQQCLDWLREKYGLYVYFKPDKPNNIGDVEFIIEKHWPDEVICMEICMTYEHARKDGILKALTLIK